MLGFVLSLGLSFATATGAAARSTDPATPIDPIFDCFHTNSAWGFTLSGKVIDSNGTIYTYGQRGKAWLPALTKDNGATWLKAAELQAKFAGAQRVGNVDAKTLAEKSVLITKAADGKIAQSDTGVRDAGSSSCHAYIHDATKQRYRDVELGSDGGVSDVRIINDVPTAADLLVWLKSVGVAK